jgi:hypothetical protein
VVIGWCGEFIGLVGGTVAGATGAVKGQSRRYGTRDRAYFWISIRIGEAGVAHRVLRLEHREDAEQQQHGGFDPGGGARDASPFHFVAGFFFAFEIALSVIAIIAGCVSRRSAVTA